MRAYAEDPRAIVLAGTIGVADRADVPISVERWFKGSGDAVVRLGAEGFGESSAACQAPRPPAGSSWIYVLWLPDEPDRLPTLSICNPQGRLDTPDGQAMLADAVATFGEGTTVRPEGETDPGPLDAVAGFLPALLAGLAVGGAAALAVLVARRSGAG